MRITILTGPWLPVPPIAGGSTERIWLELAEQFAAQGHHVTLLSRSHPDLPKEEEQNGVHHLRSGGAPQSGVRWLDLVRDFAYALRRLPEMPPSDVTVINDFWMPVLAGYRRTHCGKLVMMVGRMPKGQFRLYPRIDRFTVASQDLHDTLVRQTPSTASRIARIPCPVGNSFLKLGAGEGTERKRGILYVGRVHPEKGLDLLIDAFRLLHEQDQDIALRIVGPHSTSLGGAGEDYLRSLQSIAKDLPVQFVGPIFDTRKLVEEYQSCTLFCYPSLAEEGETFGVAPLEAMACGAVPVVSDLRCFTEHVRDGVTGFVFSREQKLAEPLAHALSTALTADLHDLRSAGRKMAEQHSSEAIARLYLEEFQRLIADES